MARKVIVRATDMAAAGRVKEGSLQVGPLELGNQIQTFSFELLDHDLAIAFVPKREDYAEVTETDGTTRLISGKVRQVTKVREMGVAGLRYLVSCQDWNAVVDEIVLNTSVSFAADLSDAYIVSQLLTSFYGPIATTVTHKLFANRSAMPAVSFGGGTVTLKQALDEVAREAYGSVWWIDADKVLHWNDFTAAPFAFSDDPNGTTTRAYRGTLEDHEDGTQPVHRVYVVGRQALTYQATDWAAVAEANERLSDEPGSPTGPRVYQKPDIVDGNLTANAKLQARGFGELLLDEATRVLTTRTLEEGLRPGQQIDLIDSVFGDGTDDLPTFDEGITVLSDVEELDASMGRFLIQRVSIEPREGAEPEYVVQMGDYEPGLTGALSPV